MRLSKNNRTRAALAVGALLVAMVGLLTGCSLIVDEEREGGFCGDGHCKLGETEHNCDQDCKSIDCGDLVCQDWENSDTCPIDCGVIGFCGDGVKEPENGEDCDGEDLGGLNCVMLGFEPGVLICTGDCHLNPSYCGRPLTCDDGYLDPGELCEASDLNGQSCGSLGFPGLGGVLECTSECEFNVEQCDYPMDKMDGENCMFDVGCSGNTCLRNVGGLPDGYCSHVCDYKVCPGWGECILDGPGGPGPLCYQSCTEPMECQSGFDCYAPYDGVPSICWPLGPAF